MRRVHASAKTGAESLASAARQCDGCDGSGWNRASRWDLALASLAMTTCRRPAVRVRHHDGEPARQHHVDREGRGRRRRSPTRWTNAVSSRWRHHRVALREPPPAVAAAAPPTPPVVGGDAFTFVAGGVGVRPSKLVASSRPRQSVGVAADATGSQRLAVAGEFRAPTTTARAPT